MTFSRFLAGAVLLLALVPAAISSNPAAAEQPIIEVAKADLAAGRLADAAVALDGHLRNAPADDTARFLLGAVQFMQAAERLGQSLYRHGLNPAPEAFSVPFFRLPVPYNSNPEPLTYDQARAMIRQFTNDLAIAEATLALVDDPVVQLPLAIGQVRLDLNGDGAATDAETLWQLYRQINQAPDLPPDQVAQFVIDFDGSDAPWLRGYSHLLMALGDVLLAHDWHEGFDHTFHTLFPRANLPFQALTDKSTRSDYARDVDEIADLIAFIHLIHWPVQEPDRMASALAHLESVVDLSRENWRRILAETDNGREWLPNPRQTGAIPGLSVTQPRIDAWMLFLGEFGAMLKGEKLMPHWRLAQGVNLRRVFLEPRPFDLVLWIQGSGALPYAEPGPISNSETWENILMLMEGDFFTYAAWFN
ncbi:MAG TPA: hypothetical protein VMT98_01435 [Verrucomicrobiae bacterium]|nr:hypothetical protein [Verrucomicrobiae bacterium]